MADTTPRAPTDAEIDAAWMESVKKHELTALFVRDFARAVLARWGAQQAPDPRPVIEMSKLADFGTVVRAVEEMHRIKGGLHP